MVQENRTRIQVTLSKEMLKNLDEVCKEIGITKSAAAAIALQKWMAEITEQKTVGR